MWSYAKLFSQLLRVEQARHCTTATAERHAGTAYTRAAVRKGRPREAKGEANVKLGGLGSHLRGWSAVAPACAGVWLRAVLVLLQELLWRQLALLRVLLLLLGRRLVPLGVAPCSG